MSGTLTIALDAMGGDHGVDVVVPAACKVLSRHDDLNIVLTGDEAVLSARIKQEGCSWGDRLRVHHASQIVGMDEHPTQALRGKKDSSMRVAIDLVKSGEAQACVSAGNTGALMAIGWLVLRTLPGIDRPAICTELPSISGSTHMLDLGANVDSDSQNLLQFAYMGSELVKAVEGTASPRVALLNIGSEEMKGNEVVKRAAELLDGSDLNYVGFAEGHDVYLSDVDVVVCDGFVGNIALKTAEGVAKLIGRSLKAEMTTGVYNRVAGAVAAPVLKRFYKRFDPRRYNGASLLGLRGIVVKSHGDADVTAFAHAVEIAVREVEKAIPDRISERLAAWSEAHATTEPKNATG
ncbi:MAG: phosphate acyltransferase PlsX [Gammaproteobacteria bacterium]